MMLGLASSEGLGLTGARAIALMTEPEAALFKLPKRAIAGAAAALTVPPPSTLLNRCARLRGRWFNELTDANRRKAPTSCREAQT